MAVPNMMQTVTRMSIPKKKLCAWCRDILAGFLDLAFLPFRASQEAGTHVGYVRVLDGLGMPAELAAVIEVPLIKKKSDIGNCSCYSTIKFLGNGMKVVERLL